MMKTKINPDKISSIEIRLKEAGKNKWYEKREPVFESSWFGLSRKMVARGQDEGWCRDGGRHAAWTTDDQLIGCGYEIIIMPTGDKVCYKIPSCIIYFSRDLSHTAWFETDEAMLAWVEDLEVMAGKKFIDTP